MRIVRLIHLTAAQMAEVTEWLRDNRIDVSHISSLDEVLKPNYIQVLDLNTYSEQDQLKLRMASWQNFSVMLQLKYKMALHKKFIRKLAKRTQGAAEVLLFEFIQLQKRQRLARRRRSAVLRGQGQGQECGKSDQVMQMLDNSSEEEEEEEDEDDDAQTVVLAQTLEEVKEEVKEVDGTVMVDNQPGDGISQPSVMVSYARYEEVLRACEEKDAMMAKYAKRLAEVETRAQI